MLVQTGMGFEGPLVLASFLTITAPVKLDTRSLREQLPRLDDTALFEPRIDVVRDDDTALCEPHIDVARHDDTALFAPRIDVVRHDDTALFEPRIDFLREVDAERELPAKQIELDAIELRDANAEGDWARQVDFELAATHGPWSIALNHHFILRNISEAQAVVSFTLEY